MEKNLKNIKKEFAANGIFYTSEKLAEQLKSYLDFTPREVYDPTCGQGNLLSVFSDDIPKFGQELYQDELEKAKERLKNFTGFHGDTLKEDGFKDKQFHAIVANPPFSIKWEPQEDERFEKIGVLPPKGKADYAFLLHILHHLAEDGKAVVLNFPGILYRGQREGKIRQWLIDNNYIERVVHIPGDQFVDTKIATCILVLSKRKKTTSVIFENTEIDKTREVSYEEIKENSYNLSVTIYVKEEREVEKIDIDKVNSDLSAIVAEKVISDLTINKIGCQLENKPERTKEILGELLIKIGNWLINDYREDIKALYQVKEEQ